MKIVNIIDIEQNYDNIVLVDGLNIEKMKTKYNWVFNATVLNAVIGEDANGLVWYMGDWICGDWKDGTWYSGIWHNGEWKKGRWYSYNLDKYELVNGRFVIIDKNETYSKFLNGVWDTGIWNDGIFGDDTISITGYTNHNVVLSGIGCAVWKSGDFHDGLFQNAVWENGNFYFGIMNSSIWENGIFYNGFFDLGIWWQGKWFGGDFIRGNWENGNFSVNNAKIMSRFGYNPYPYSATTTIWKDGVFENGEFYSGYLSGDTPTRRVYQKTPVNRIISSNQAHLELDNIGLSNNHNRTHWSGGTFKNGYWYGGTWEKGTWEFGTWYNGVFSGSTLTDSIFESGYWYDGLWVYGTFKGGYWYGGMWLGGNMEGGYMQS